MKTEKEYLADLEEKGTVTMKIHPEHIEAIRAKYLQTKEAEDKRLHMKKQYEVQKSKTELYQQEMWLLIHESYDAIMDKLADKSEAQEYQVETDMVLFRNSQSAMLKQGQKQMDKMGLPKEFQEKIINQIKRLGGSEGNPFE